MQKIVNMDIQTILISIVICVVVAILVYLITVCSMREKSFEEVIAEQRRMQEQVLQKNRQQKKQRKEKFKKGKGGGKSSTDEADSNKEEIESEPVVAETHKMVELEIDPVIIEPTEMKKEHKKENKKNAKQPKPILHNKDEKPLVKETAEVEQFQPEHMPKDSVELKYSEKKKGKESKKEKAESKERVKEPAVKATEAAEPVKMVVEESIQVAVAAPTSASVKSGKKVKPPPEAVDTADGGISGTKLITMVRSATLSDKDIQHLIEILLNRQGTPVGSAGWTQISKGSDPVAQLKKQLEDKERAWQDEAKRAQEYSTSLRETQRQLSTERQKVALVEKQSHEQLEAKNQEIQAFHSRMQQSHEQHMHEVNSLTMKVKHLEGQMGQDHTAVIRRVQEENNQLKTQLAQFGSVDVSGLQQKVKIMEDEMNKNAMKISSADNIKKGLEAKVAHYEEQLRKYEASQRDSESVLSRKLNEVTEQLRKSEAQNNNLNRDLQGSRDSSRRMENDLANMKNKLQSMEQSRSDRENVLKTVEAKLKDSDTARKGLETKVTTFEHQLADKDKELQELKQANASLTVEVKTVQEVHSQQGAPAHNGPVDEGDKILRADHERLLAEKSTEVGKLSDDLSGKTAEIDKLRQEVDAQKKKNNELEAEKLKATSQVQTELKQLKQDLNTKVSEVEGLTTELETLRKQNNELQDSTSSQIQKSAEDFEKLNQDLKDRQAEVANLQKQLETQQNQNKDLSAQVEKFDSDAKNTSSTSDDTKKLKEALDAKLVQIKELETLVAQLKEENADSKNLKETLDAKLVHIQKLETSVTELKEGGQSDTKNLQENLDAKVAQIEQLEALVAQLKEEKGDAKNLQEMLDAKSVQIQELEVSVKQLTEEKADLQSQVGKLSSVSETTEVHVTQISSLNEEVNIKVTEITKLNQEIQSLKKENHELRAGCEKASAALTCAEKSAEDIAHVQAELSSKVTEVSKLQLIIQEREKENKALQDDLGELRRAFRSAQDNIAQLREAEKKILICSELQGQVSTQSGEITVLKKTISDKDVEINILRERSEKVIEAFEKAQAIQAGTVQVQMELEEKVNRIAVLSDELELQKLKTSELQAQMRKRLTRNTGNSKMDELLEELDVKDDEITKLRDIVKNYWKENNELKDKLSSLESNEVFTEPRSVRTSADSLSEVEHVEKELHLCRRQISLTELKERMEKTVENGQVSSGADEDHSREVLKRLFPDVKVKEEQSQEEWLQTFAIEVKKVVESSKTSPVENGDLARELQETRQSQSKLQSQVQHYKSVLADTEGILNKLQSSVETEEKHWKDKLEQVQSEKQKLEEEVKRLKSSEVCRGTEV